jgi:proline racemase
VPVTTSRGEVSATVAYGGAIYATLPAAQLGLSINPEHLSELIALGREIQWALNDSEHAVHPSDPRLNGIYATIWFDELNDAEGQVHQRNVAVFADGEVDRSPCGSGSCARLAALTEEGRLPAGTALRHDSIVGSTFTGTVLETVEVAGRRAVLPQVTGMAYRTGEHVSPSTHTTRWSPDSCCGEVPRRGRRQRVRKLRRPRACRCAGRLQWA